VASHTFAGRSSRGLFSELLQKSGSDDEEPYVFSFYNDVSANGQVRNPPAFQPSSLDNNNSYASLVLMRL
jgi:hypothetical protein